MVPLTFSPPLPLMPPVTVRVFAALPAMFALPEGSTIGVVQPAFFIVPLLFSVIVAPLLSVIVPAAYWIPSRLLFRASCPLVATVTDPLVEPSAYGAQISNWL